MIYVCTLNDTLIGQSVIAGKNIIKTTEDLYKAIADKQCTELEIYSDFVKAFFTISSFNILLEQIKQFNPKIKLNTMDSIGSSRENMQLIQCLNDKEDFINWIMANKVESFNLFKQLCSEHNSKVREFTDSNAKINTLSIEYMRTLELLDSEREKTNRLEHMLGIMTAKYDSLVSKINMNYNIGITPEHMRGVDIEYPQYQNILYIKEITRVAFVDTLIYYLLEILRVTYKVPSRLLVIEAPYSYNRAELYPACKTHLDLEVSDICSGNIFCAGYQDNVVKGVLQNTTKVPYLIVLDRSGWKEPFIRGKKVETVYTVSDIKDLRDMPDANHVISYLPTTLHIQYINNFDELSVQEKMSSYSSMTIMKTILNMLEGVAIE